MIKFLTIVKIFAFQKHICKSCNLKNQIRFQLFGLDYVIDKNLKPYLLEMNKAPNMTFKHGDEEKKMKVMSDLIYLLELDKQPANYKNDFILIL